MQVNDKRYNALRLLGKGKGGYSWLVEWEGARYVLKQIHHEPCDFYTFGDKLAAERRDYLRLQEAGLRIPRLLEVDVARERLVKEFIDGPTGMELVQAGTLTPEHLQQVQQMADRARAAGLNIDYYPTNFVFCQGRAYYIDYECNPFMEQWSFETWGRPIWLQRPYTAGKPGAPGS